MSFKKEEEHHKRRKRVLNQELKDHDLEEVSGGVAAEQLFERHPVPVEHVKTILRKHPQG